MKTWFLIFAYFGHDGTLPPVVTGPFTLTECEARGEAWAAQARKDTTRLGIKRGERSPDLWLCAEGDYRFPIVIQEPK